MINTNELELDWEKVTTFKKSEMLPNFKTVNALKKDLSNLEGVDEYFGLLLTDRFLQQVCIWTNNYVETKRNWKKRQSHEKKLEKLSPTKVKAFLSLLLLMPLIEKPGLKDYWSRKALTSIPGLRNILTRDEFY